MTPEEALAAILIDAGTLNRTVYAVLPPADPTYPCVVYTLISSVHDHDLQGSAKVVRQRYQLDHYGLSLSDVVSSAEQTRQLLQGYEGGQVVFAELDSEQHLHEPIDEGNPQRLYRKIVDYLVTFLLP